MNLSFWLLRPAAGILFSTATVSTFADVNNSDWSRNDRVIYKEFSD